MLPCSLPYNIVATYKPIDYKPVELPAHPGRHYNNVPTYKLVAVALTTRQCAYLQTCRLAGLAYPKTLCLTTNLLLLAHHCAYPPTC